ncbi:hypothetical protein GOBAR_AA20636 [Gossypium barbadense]|uniref:Uncharacterized protein n=1 Tax=Gossypium barbadense TaxID=3634 RepID=A0A2P5X9N8_GOSBA|nr:hypothetical protein GOBAR_AA20636 [Gossypium barbadense]
MVALYCWTRRNQNAPIQLFDELAGVEATEDPTPLGEEDGAQEPCMVVRYLGDDVYHSSDHSDHEVDSESDPDVDEVPDDIDDKA